MITLTRSGMTVFHDAGRIHAIMRGSRDIDPRKRFALDEASEIIDSVFAKRVIDALRAKLDPSDVDRILKIMRDADLISEEEKRAVNEEMTGGSGGESMASDAAFLTMFPHSDRLKTGGFGFGTSHGGPRIKVPKESAAEAERYDEMFPNNARLK